MTDVMTTFETEYSKLNTLQKQAVDTVEGPVMVIAGPGTGKTQILSRRVANILINYETNPDEIVCLTYTEAGASEMLDRLEKLLGDQGRRVRVSTIHAFCSGLILANPERFGKQPKLISAAVTYELLKEIMDEHIQEGHILYKNSGERYSASKQLLSLHSKMKREKLTKEKIEHEVAEYIKSIELSVPGDDLFKEFKYAKKYRDKQAGDLKPGFEKEVRKYDKLVAGADIVTHYQSKISENNYFDFDDMILWTIEQLESQEDFQEEVSSQIRYLFVDEFQDTSVLQNRLVDLLVKGVNRPNLFVVGDDDQSIYRFQGVSASNISDFDKKYQPTKIVLQENYRSSQAIIDAAKALISQNPREEKALIASGANKTYQNQHPILTTYESEAAEMHGVMTEIKALLNQGVKPSDIGVIYGRNSFGQRFANLLRDNGIFVQIKEKEDLFEEAFFKKLLAVLTYLSRPYRNIRELRKLLYFDFFGVAVEDLVAIRQLQGPDKITVKSIATIDQSLEKIRQKLLKSKAYLSPMFILQEVMKTLGIDHYVMASPEKYRLVTIWRELHQLMVTETMLHSQLTLAGFLNRIKGLKEMRVALPIESIAATPDNCVQLMTAHGSKGLEFDYVFMMKCTDGKRKGDEWPGGENKSENFALPPSLNGKEINETQLKKEENRRLFYVAMTRAKKVLSLSCSQELPKTSFLMEFAEHLLEVDGKVGDSIEGESAQPSVLPVSAEKLSSILADFKLSYSSLNSFLKCPLSFYFNKVLKFPAETNDYMVFGNIVHEVLEGIYVPLKEGVMGLSEHTILSKKEAIALFEKVFENKAGELVSERSRNDNYARGLAILENLYREPDYLKPGLMAIEHEIESVTLGDISGVPTDLSAIKEFNLTGKIDRIELDGNVIRLIDYKTGNPKKAKEKLSSPTEKEPLGGDYWRQAAIYFLLIQHAGLDVADRDIQVRYVFLEDEDDARGFSEVDVTIAAEDTDKVLEQIVVCLKDLLSGRFTTGGDHAGDRYACDYCTLARLNDQPAFDNTPATESATLKKACQNVKSLSVSTLNRFLDCSMSFYFDQVLQLSPVAGLTSGKKAYESKVTTKHAPTGPVFGTVMHHTLEQIYAQGLTLKQALTVFDEALFQHQAEIISTMTAEEMTPYGHRLLANLFEHYIPNSCRTVELEKELHVTLGDNLPINGIIDKLEFDGDVIRVVDYKTGLAQHGIEELASGGNYWRQAAFYNLLLHHSAIETEGKTIETQYIFLDDEDSETGYSIHTLTLTEEDLAQVVNQIQDFWTKVRESDLTGSCQKKDCDFCRLGESVLHEMVSKS